MFNMQLGAQDFLCAKGNNKMAAALSVYLAVSVTKKSNHTFELGMWNVYGD
jgi:hypothetical protein